MNLIQNLTLKSRLIVMVVFFGLLMLLIGGAGLLGMREGKDALNTVYTDRLVPTSQINQVIAVMHDNRAQLLLALQHDPESAFFQLHEHGLEQHLNQIRENIENANVLWRDFMATHLTEDEKRLADEFAKARARYLNEGILPVKAAIEQGRFDEANRILLQQLNPAFVAAREVSDRLLKLQLDVARADFVAAEKRYQSTLTVTLLMIVAALVGSSVMAAM